MATKKKPNRLMILLGVLILAGALVFLAADPLGFFKPSAEQQEQTEGVNKVLFGSEAKDITAFEIKQPAEASFRLVKEKDQWYAVGDGKKYKANMERVQKLLDELPGLRADGVASEQPGKYAEFEVDDAKAIQLSIFTAGDKPEAKLYIGKPDSTYQSSFVRYNQDKPIYRASTNVKSLVGFSFRDYRTKQPWNFDPMLATSLEVLDPKGGKTVVFTKKDEFWQLPDGKNANQNDLKEMLKKFSELQVADFVDNPDDKVTQLSNAQPALKVKTPAGDYVLKIGGKEASDNFVGDQDGLVYKVYEYNLKFYQDLDLAKLSLSDVPKEQPKAGAQSGGAKEPEQPEEGIKGGIKSETDKGQGK